MIASGVKKPPDGVAVFCACRAKLGVWFRLHTIGLWPRFIFASPLFAKAPPLEVELTPTRLAQHASFGLALLATARADSGVAGQARRVNPRHRGGGLPPAPRPRL
jgi:hypothetical protein